MPIAHWRSKEKPTAQVATFASLTLTCFQNRGSPEKAPCQSWKQLPSLSASPCWLCSPFLPPLLSVSKCENYKSQGTAIRTLPRENSEYPCHKYPAPRRLTSERGGQGSEAGGAGRRRWLLSIQRSPASGAGERPRARSQGSGCRERRPPWGPRSKCSCPVSSASRLSVGRGPGWGGFLRALLHFSTPYFLHSVKRGLERQRLHRLPVLFLQSVCRSLQD